MPEWGYIDALLSDLDHDIAWAGKRRIDTIFLGGGTPSLFGADVIGGLLDGIAKRLDLAEDAEITLEANPGTVEAGKFEGFRRAGVNRLSIGVQSFDDGHLQRLGRIHNGFEAVGAVEAARKAGFGNFNLDLMFGLPGQTEAQALADVLQAIALGPTHISFYQLTLEPNTLFHRYPPTLPSEDAIWQIQQVCQAELAAAGYGQYEVSAYAQEGYRCRHNLNYWRFGDYLGIGAGAHGKLTLNGQGVVRYWKHKHPQQYLSGAGTPECMGARHSVHEDELPLEFLMNQLRLREGFSAVHYRDCTGLGVDTLEPGLSRCIELGLLESLGDTVCCTDQGWNFLDDVLEQFVADVRR
jgi:oxygen-independent coproporphyrinogen-3 oxidase